MIHSKDNAPGWPGANPRWTSSAKSGVGTSLSSSSHVWFTLSHGILNEIYFPRIDQACIRDMGLIITDGRKFFSEEKRHTTSRLNYISPGVPAFHLINTCKKGFYSVVKDVLTDPLRNVVLQKTTFSAAKGEIEDYHLFVILSPHLGNRGFGNTAWIGDYKGNPVLFAQRENHVLALACSTPWVKRSAGFVGVSDGWQDLVRNKNMMWTYDRAENGNVALTAEIDLHTSRGIFILALGFGKNVQEAGDSVLASLSEDFEAIKNKYIKEWQVWQNTLSLCKEKNDVLCNISTAVLRIHEAKDFPGGLLASLSFPWGFAKGDDDIGGYHLVWPRDLVEAAGALLAAGAIADVQRAILYLKNTQNEDGHWPQNMWIDGTPFWDGIQMDETSFPIILVDMAYRENALTKDDILKLWPMVRRAISFILSNGPVTQQDRWEEDPGYSPFTLSVEIASLLAAADMAEMNKEPLMAKYLREIADTWNEGIERWTYVTDTEIARRAGVEGYYVRIAPPETSDAASPAKGFVAIKNRPYGQSTFPATQIISTDALALVRFGLRGADDPRILNTIKVIDMLLKVDTSFSPVWHRYNDDGYGEHEDGSPFDGTGKGRAWPLLTGERAHYELAAGRNQEAERLLKGMSTFANKGGMIPEQVWDSPDVPEKELFFGRPSGSAMPLLWAHAEYVKLVRSLRDNRVFDMPFQTQRRYVKTRTVSSFVLWRFNHKCRTMPSGKKLRIEIRATAEVRWSVDDWKTSRDIRTRDTGLGIHVADLDTETLVAGSSVSFTFHWIYSDSWEGTNFVVKVTAQK
jgi:glucoamylase